MRRREARPGPGTAEAGGVSRGVAGADATRVSVSGSVPDLRLLLPALAAWVVLALTVGWSPHASVAGAGACVVAALVVHLVRGRSAVALTLGAVGAVLLSASGHAAVAQAGPVAELAVDRAVVRFEGVVLSEPRVVTRGDERPDLVVLTVRLDSVQARGVRSEVRTPVVVFADLAWAQVSWRAPVEGTGRLGPSDPGDAQVASLAPLGPPSADDGVGPVLGAADAVRERLRRSVDPLPPDPRGLVPGLVIGDTTLTPPELTDAMLATGMSHLSAVSGSNVAIVLGAVLLVCGAAGVPRRWRPWLAALCLVGFVVLCRPEPSVLRAGAMGLVGLFALTASRRRASLPALAATVLVLLLVDPWLSRSYGFALSTLATLGLVLLGRPWGRALARRLPARLAWLGYAVAIPVVAQVMCGPVIVLLQGSVSTVAVVANLLAAPFVAPATVLGVLAALLGTAWAPLGVLLAWSAALPAWCIAGIARTAAGVPGGTLDWPDGAVGAALLTALTVAVLVLGPGLVELTGRHRRVATVVAAALLAFWAPVPVVRDGWPPAGWLVAGCDVGQGDAFLLATGPGRAVLVDTGPDPALLDRCLDELGVQALDALVLTHYHSDHVGGVSAALDRPVEEVLVTGVRAPPRVADAVLGHLLAAQVVTREASAGQQYSWGPTGQVQADVVGPDARTAATAGANDASIVLHVVVDPDGPGPGRGLTALLTGDIEPDAAARVRRALPGVRVDVLKVAHHGSAAQDDALVRQLAAPVALIGVGADNDFGHPAPSLLRLLGNSGSTVLRTDRDGHLLVGVVGDRLWTATSRGRRPRGRFGPPALR